MESGRPIEVQMFADLACPWCYLGLRRLQQARALRPARPVRIAWWPFLLNPQLPPEGMDRAAYVRAKFGGEVGSGLPMWPPMGSGQHASAGYGKAAYQRAAFIHRAQRRHGGEQVALGGRLLPRADVAMLFHGVSM